MYIFIYLYIHGMLGRCRRLVSGLQRGAARGSQRGSGGTRLNTSINLSVYPSIYPSIYLSMYIYLHIYKYIYVWFSEQQPEGRATAAEVIVEAQYICKVGVYAYIYIYLFIYLFLPPALNNDRRWRGNSADGNIL